MIQLLIYADAADQKMPKRTCAVIAGRLEIKPKRPTWEAKCEPFFGEGHGVCPIDIWNVFVL